MIIHDPGNYLKIDTMFAFISQDEQGNEGVVGMPTANGVMAMVGADMRMVDKLRPIAKQIAKHTKKKIVLIKFENRTDLEVIE
jgi:hypothetical protein